MGGQRSPVNRKSAICRAEAQERCSELRVDLVPSVEVLSCWVIGGGISAVGSRVTPLTSRTREDRKVAAVRRTLDAGRPRDGAMG